MNRMAINPAGWLGCSYDGYRDQVIEQTKVSVQGRVLPSFESLRCELINGNKNANFNILEMIGMENELRLSLLLRLTKRTGIAGVLNYSHRIDEYTRFLYYSCLCRTEEFRKKNARIQGITGLDKFRMNATHIITNVSLGIDLVVVLQLPSDIEILHKIDFILRKIRALLEDKSGIFRLTFDEKYLLKKVLNTTVYSNVPSLTGSLEISDIIHQINIIKTRSYRSHPVTYNLQPIMRLSVTFRSLPTELRDNIEQYMLQIRNRMKYLEASLSGSLPELLCGHLQDQLKEAHIQCSQLKEKLKYEMQRFSTFVVNVRRSRTEAVEETDQALHDNEARVLKTSIDNLIQDLNVLKTKGQWIADLEQKNFEYWNTLERNLDKCDNLRDIKRILFNKNTYSRVLCSSDSLNQQKNSKLTELYRQLTEERKTNPTLRLIYLDFSYSSFPLQDMVILSSSETDHLKIHSIEQSSLQVDVPQGFQLSSSPRTSTDEIINILLLGETGTGKSTFINAFANYLTFNSLEQAQSNEPIVLIPVSFVVTVRDSFEEHTVQFGEFDSLNNENFNSIGHSVTQHCKSYVFDLHQFDGKKLRIIDTPGFGDTRGLNQDDQNMEHILQYINNLSHLNAICFLLKPNSSRLNMFFSACLTQLFSLLAPHARDNIIFCFTNARSTFYTPGDTGPLLKKMLASYSISDIPFQKDNTFCFDSGSFRYLVALQNDIPCDKEDKQEYESSWSISAKESNRLIAYINQKLFVYPIENEWQSIKRAQFEISHMIRPILETMRNILRNLILCENNLSNQFIELSSKPVWCSTTRCLTCKSDPEQVGTFWFIPTTSHEIQNYCRLCSCTLDHHIPMEYILEYQCLYGAFDRDQNAMNVMLDILCNASAAFAHFLMHIAHSTKDNPFFIGLVEMIVEETHICESQKSAHFNIQLVEKLRQLENLYEQRMNKIKPDDESVKLAAIYKLIKTMGEYPPVREQMTAVKETQRITMKQNEYEVGKI